MDDLYVIPEEVLASLRELADEFHYHRRPKPPHYLVLDRLLAFGVADAATLASLILSAWPLIFPRDGRPKCPYKGPLTGRCEARIIHTSYDSKNKQVLLVCEQGHETLQRTPRVSS